MAAHDNKWLLQTPRFIVASTQKEERSILRRTSCAALFTVIALISVLENIDARVLRSIHPQHKPQSRIINGASTWPRIIPYMVRVMVDVPVFKGTITCGVSIISERHILTAAHCLQWDDCAVDTLYFGAVKQNQIQWFTSMQIGGSFVKHPQYDNHTKAHDIAIITTVKPIYTSPSSVIGPIRLPSDEDVYKTYNGDKVETFGWGKTKDQSKTLSPELMSINLTVIDFNTCLSQMKRAPLYPFHICTDGYGDEFHDNYTKPVGTCYGDSGGPFVYNGTTLIGVTLGGPSNSCEKYAPSVFTEVIPHLDWIRKELNTF